MSEEKTIQCQGEGCGRQAYKVDEDYYTCGRCGWAGSSDNPVVVLERHILDCERILAEHKSLLRDCHDLLNDCGFYFVNGAWNDSENPDEGDEQ